MFRNKIWNRLDGSLQASGVSIGVVDILQDSDVGETGVNGVKINTVNWRREVGRHLQHRRHGPWQ